MQAIALPKDTVVQHDDTTYAAIALLDLVLTGGGDLAGGSVLVVNVNGEMLTLPVYDVLFPGLRLAV